MGNCMSENEDIGMSQNASSQQAVGSNVDTISDADLMMAQQDAMAGLKQRLILNFSAINLPNMDTKSKTDSVVVLWQLSGPRQMKQQVGMTEVVMDNLNPVYVQAIEVDYFFEEA